VDRIAAIVGTADAEVIVMRGVDDGLVAEFWIAAGEFRDDVAGFERANLARDRSAEFVSERDRLEIARRGGLRERIEIIACGFEEIARDFLRHPCRDVQRRLTRRELYVRRLVAPRVADDRPRISG